MEVFGVDRALQMTGPRSQLPVEDDAKADRLSRFGVGMERALVGTLDWSLVDIIPMFPFEVFRPSISGVYEYVLYIDWTNEMICRKNCL